MNVLLVALVVLVAETAEEPVTDPAPASASRSVVTAPVWRRTPTGRDMWLAYPPIALHRGIQGRTTMVCDVLATGSLTGCRIITEQPEGHGFANAALRLAAKFRMAETTVDGVPVGGGRVTIPISFRIP